MTQATKSGFGFVNADDSIRQMASSVKPKPRDIAAPMEISDAVDRVAADVGFESREATRRVVKRPARPKAEPMQQLAMRLPVSVLASFAKFAESEGLSYPKALAALLDRERRR